MKLSPSELRSVVEFFALLAEIEGQTRTDV